MSNYEAREENTFSPTEAPLLPVCSNLKTEPALN